MNKKILLAALLAGILMLIASVAITVAAASGANIIGGAGWPTLMLYFRKTGADLLALLGVAVTVIATVLLVKCKK